MNYPDDINKHRQQFNGIDYSREIEVDSVNLGIIGEKTVGIYLSETGEVIAATYYSDTEDREIGILKELPVAWVAKQVKEDRDYRRQVKAELLQKERLNDDELQCAANYYG